MAVSPAKKTATKTSAKKTTTKKATSTRKTTAKKTTTKSRATKKRTISAEERYKMTEVAAYYIAEHNNFQGNPTDFWIAAEAEINAKLS